MLSRSQPGVKRRYLAAGIRLTEAVASGPGSAASHGGALAATGLSLTDRLSESLVVKWAMAGAVAPGYSRLPACQPEGRKAGRPSAGQKP
jgi:hypothetical protein